MYYPHVGENVSQKDQPEYASRLMSSKFLALLASEDDHILNIVHYPYAIWIGEDV
jgi:hypothetical protein